MEKTFSRSRSVRYRSARSRANNTAVNHKAEKKVADDLSATVVASEGGSLTAVGVGCSAEDSLSESLRSELQEACRERMKAAEYGLVLLEEKEFLQQEVDRLEVQFESSRQELDILAQQLQDARSESSYFKQQVAALRNDLVEECDRREDVLVEDSKTLLQQLSATKRSLRVETEQRQHLGLEVEKLRTVEQDLRRDLVSLRQQSSEDSHDSRELKRTNVKLEKQLLELTPSNGSEKALMEEMNRLQTENCELVEEVNALSEDLESLQPDFFDSESDQQLQQDCAVEQVGRKNAKADGQCVDSEDSGMEYGHSSGGMLSPQDNGEADHHQTKPFLDAEAVDQLHQMDAVSFKRRTPRRTSNSSAGARNDFQEKRFEERERELLRQASMLRAELVAALTEVDGLRSMSNEAETAAAKQITRIQEELDLVQQRERDQRQQSTANEEQLYNRAKSAGESEDVLSHLGAELRALNADLTKVGRLSSSLSDLRKKKVDQLEVDMKDVVEVTKWGSNIQLLGTIRQQVRSVKSALDTLLMQSLQKTAAKIGTGASQTGANLCDERKESLQDDLRKAQQMVTAKTHESTQLHSLLKMARLTANANLEREKSAREQQVSTLQLKITALEKHIAKLRQDSKECAQERNTFQTRCEEYLVQLAKQKKDVSSLRDETKLLDSMLNKAISQKLALTEKLENLELELQQQQQQQHRQRLQQKQQKQVVASSSAKVLVSPQRTASMSSRLRFIRVRGKKTDDC